MEEVMRRVVYLLMVVVVCATVIDITRSNTKAEIEIAKTRHVENIGGKCVGVRQ